jgi:hypothetical protein
MILQETYSKNSFIRNWIIRKSRLAGKLTQLHNEHKVKKRSY